MLRQEAVDVVEPPYQPSQNWQVDRGWRSFWGLFPMLVGGRVCLGSLVCFPVNGKLCGKCWLVGWGVVVIGWGIGDTRWVRICK